MLQIKNESCVFLGDAPAKLLFRPAGTVRLGNPTAGKVFRENVDFSVDRESGTVSRLPGSEIPVLTERELYPSRDAVLFPEPDANAVSGGLNGKNLRFDGKLFFAKHQVEAEYETDRENWPDNFFRKSPYCSGAESFHRMVSLGDSITEGYNSSAFIGEKPFRKPYAGLVADALGAQLFNLGRNGASVDLLADLTERTAALKPDLVTIAFGMNDLVRYSAEQYLERIAEGTQVLRKDLPESCIVVVSPMSGNPEWNHTPVEQTRAFAEILREWTYREKIVFADVFSVWDSVIKRKGFFSMTGNGVNHPNDFGHSLYAGTILSALGRGGINRV